MSDTMLIDKNKTFFDNIIEAAEAEIMLRKCFGRNGIPFGCVIKPLHEDFEGYYSIRVEDYKRNMIVSIDTKSTMSTIIHLLDAIEVEKGDSFHMEYAEKLKQNQKPENENKNPIMTIEDMKSPEAHQ